jgi:acyl-coenzyme A synthetase/AMP-(fatty) acid ligase
MLGKHLILEGRERSGRLALVHGGTRATYGELAARAAGLADKLRPYAGQRVGLTAAEPAAYLTAAAALDYLGAHVFLVGRRGAAETAAIARQFSLEALLGEPEAKADPAPAETALEEARQGKVTLLTSGTTGVPKAANHTWTTLASPVRRDASLSDTRWLCAYPLHLYAGTQVLLQALLNWAALVVPETMEPRQIARTMAEDGVTHASGTPTFWRQVLFFGGRERLKDAALRQITLGGEAVTQELLDGLGSLWPAARIVHIYASTELGRLFSVTDGREGFPARYLEKAPESDVEMRIVDGELHARSKNAMLGYESESPASSDPAGWRPTGDLVEQRGDRILFRGRSSDVINVGGHKVAPLKVEQALRGVAGVADLRVYPRRSSLTGQIVAMDVVLAPEADEKTVRAALLEAVRARLLPHEAPRLLEFVQALDPNPAFKLVRKEKA